VTNSSRLSHYVSARPGEHRDIQRLADVHFADCRLAFLDCHGDMISEHPVDTDPVGVDRQGCNRSPLAIGDIKAAVEKLVDHQAILQIGLQCLGLAHHALIQSSAIGGPVSEHPLSHSFPAQPLKQHPEQFLG
jgi:hypothetical protein